MSNTLTDAYIESFENGYYATIGRSTSIASLRDVFDFRVDQAQSIRLSKLHGIGVFSAYSSPTSAAGITASKSTTTGLLYHKRVELLKNELTDAGPQLAGETGMELAKKAEWSIVNLMWTQFWGMRSLAHPEAGDLYQAGAKFADTYTTGSGSPVSQANELNQPLSAASLNTAIKMLREQKTDDGDPAGSADGELVLVVQPDQEANAADLVRRQSEIFDGSGLQSAAYNRLIRRMVVAPASYSANAWVLWNRTMSPLMPWMKQLPEAKLVPDQYDPIVHASSDFQFGVVAKPSSNGFIFGYV